MTHMAFGALNGVRTVWGVPGGAYSAYDSDDALVVEDIPPCVKGHRGGPTAEMFINTVEQRFRPDGARGFFWN